MSAILKMLEASKNATAGPWRHTEEDSDSAPEWWDWYVQAVCGKAWDNIASCGAAAWEDGWKYTREQREANAAFISESRNATADIQRLVSWVERQGEAIHGIDSDGDYCRAGQYDRTIDADGKLGEYTCTCGLDEIQSLLRS